MKKIISIIIVLLCLTAFQANAAVPYDSYTYSMQDGTPKAVSCPVPYYPAFSVNKSSIGIALSNPASMCFDSKGYLYIANTGMNQVVILNPDYSLNRVLEFLKGENDTTDFLSAPEGLFITAKGELYICDTGNKRIVVLDKTDRIIKIYDNIVPTGGNTKSAEDYSFAPTRLVVDDSGNMYILVKNEYQGIVQTDSNGNFISFLGSNKVTYDPVTKLWKKIMSKAQRAQMEQFIPVEYTNLSLDREGLMLTVSKADSVSPVKRLNLSGADVLTRNGYIDVVGDVYEEKDKSSQFSDICGDSAGNIYLLDSYKGRVFVYNSEGYLFYAFGGLGTQLGTFSNPSDIEVRGTDILTLDAGNGRITVFRRTNYASLISEADEAYNIGDYETSIEKWNRVTELNSNFELAYAQIGKVYLRKERYKDAMQYFELGNCRGDTVTKTTGYNKAFSEQRRETAERFLAPTVILIAAAVAAAEIIKIIRRRKRHERKD